MNVWRISGCLFKIGDRRFEGAPMDNAFAPFEVRGATIPAADHRESPRLGLPLLVYRCRLSGNRHNGLDVCHWGVSRHIV